MLNKVLMAIECGPFGDITNTTTRAKSVFSCVFNLNTFLKSVSTSKSRVTYDLDTTTHKIVGVVGCPLYLATPVSTTLPKSHLSL